MLGHLMTNSLGISQGHNVHSSCWLICGNWVKPFTVISCHQQSWYWITSLGYCWSAPDLSGWPERWDAKKKQKTSPPWILYPILLAARTSWWLKLNALARLTDSLSSSWMSSLPLYMVFVFATGFQNSTSMTEENATSHIAEPLPRPLVPG